MEGAGGPGLLGLLSLRMIGTIEGKRRVSGVDEGPNHANPSGPSEGASPTTMMSKDHTDAAAAIPDDCLIEIFLRLRDENSWKALALVSKRWYNLQASARQRMCIPCDTDLSRLSSILAQYHALTEITVAYRNVSVTSATSSRARLNLDLLASPRENSEFPLRLLQGKLSGNAPKGVSFADAGVELIGTAAGGRLRKLNLEGCTGMGDVALSEIGHRCVRLEELVLSSRHITPEGLHSVAHGCRALRRVELSGCTGEVGDRGIRSLASSCRSLEVLTVGCRKVTDEGIAELASSCSLLRTLDLRGCLGVRCAALVALGKGCPLLEELFVSFCQGVGDDGVIGLTAGCPNLRLLHVKSCPITDRALAAISENCVHIAFLDISFCDRIGRIGLAALAQGPGRSSLARLDLQQCRQLADGALNALVQGCTALSTLDLLGCQGVTDEGVRVIAESCPALESLFLGCFSIGDRGLQALANNAQFLSRLHLWGCSGVTDRGIALLVRGCTSLRHISVKGPPHGLTDASLVSLATLGCGLRSVTMPFCLGITDAGLATLAESCRDLEKLGVSGCDQITSAGIAVVARLCGPSLRKLDFSRCPKVGDDALAVIGECCPKLTKLLASSCFAITHAGVSSIANGVCALTLREFSLASCPHVADRSMAAIAKGCPNLESLFVSDCPQISCFGMQAIEDGCLSMRVCISDSRF